MKKEERRFRGVWLSIVIMFLLVVWVGQAQSQDKYPTRAIDVIVPYGAGGGTDQGTRIATAYVSEKWGVPVNVINKPGGNTIPAMLDLYNSAPDGYTMLGDNIGSSSMLEVAVKNVPFKVMDHTFVATTYNAPLCFLVPTASPIKNLKDLEAEAKKDPQNFLWTLMGGASGPDFAMRQFMKHIGLDINKTKPVAVRGGTEVVTMVSAGNVKVGGSTLASSAPMLDGGLIRVLCVLDEARYPGMPDVPTAKEQGYNVVVEHWFGISGPPKLPASIVEKWSSTLEKMLKEPAIIAKLKNMHAFPYYRNAKQFREIVDRQRTAAKKLWGIK